MTFKKGNKINLGRKYPPERQLKINATRRTRKYPRISMKQLGEKNSMWKGDNVGYNSLHRWVKKRLPKPDFCQNCNERPPHDLANITGIYNRDLKNWIYLCRSCHMRSDGRMKNLKYQV